MDTQRAKALVQDLSPAHKEAVATLAMAWEDGCPEGKRRFFKEYGFPMPPAKAVVSVEVVVQCPDGVSVEEDVTWDTQRLMEQAVTTMVEGAGGKVQTADYQYILDED